MGLYLLSDLNEKAAEHSKNLERSIASLRVKSKHILKQLPVECQEDAEQTLKQIQNILYSYSDLIAYNLHDSEGNPTRKKIKLNKLFFDILNDIDRKDEIYSMSQLSIAFIMLIEGYIDSINNSLNKNISDLEVNNSFIKQGIALLATLHAWIAEEIIATPKVLSHMNKETELKTKSKVSKTATDFRYSAGRDLYRAALSVARKMWEEGSDLKHHQMKNYLINFYREGEFTKSPFEKFDANCGYTARGLLERLKALLKEINRSDLISGQKM